MAFLSPSQDFYRQVMLVLKSADIPFLVGGAYALRVYTGISRDTKDFDLMVRSQHVDGALEAFRKVGFRAGVVFTHWLAKVHHGGDFVDVIYSSGNGICPVDDEWFSHARRGRVWDEEVDLCPPEEMIWQKAYIMERERFDGGDVAHLLAHCGAEMDWERLVRRFGEDWPVLLAHLILFQYIYPSEAAVIPRSFLDDLVQMPHSRPAPAGGLCRGPLLSRAQYLDDIERRGFVDARTTDRCLMTDEQIRAWTDAIERTPRAD